MSTDRFNPLDFTACLDFPERLVSGSAWIEHVPFGMAIVEITKPKILVELGAFSGTSYCAFCQTVKKLNLSTKCYAIDNWQGDPHGGYYGEEVFQDLKQHHDIRYGMFSTLIRSEFDEAVKHFGDKSIDLLHIDGYHTYEAVKHDFETWLPKLSDSAIVLFHDTNEYTSDFGIWKFWDEVRPNYPSFEFNHGHGLGILGVGKNYPEILRDLILRPDPVILKGFFQILGSRLQNTISLANYERSINLSATSLAEAQTKTEAAAAEISLLHEKMKYLTNLVEEKKQISEKQKEEIELLTTEKSIDHNEISLLRQELEKVISMANAIEIEKATSEKYRTRSSELEGIVANQEDEIIRYVTSKSWRYTRPFRKILKRIKRLLKRA